MERNILIEYGIHKLCDNEQFGFLTQCTYRKWLFLVDEKGNRIKYYAILLSQRPIVF